MQYIDQHFTEVVFSGNELREMELTKCTFERCKFSFADMADLHTNGCRFVMCDLGGARLNASIHMSSSFENCTFADANLFASQFIDCKMIGSDFAGAKMDGISVSKGDWSFTNLRQASLAKQDLRNIRFVEADLYDANLENSDLRGCDLSRTHLAKAQLRGADLRGATMDGVDFTSVAIAGARIDVAQAILFCRAYGATVD